MRSVATPSGTGFWSETDTKTSEYRKSCMVRVNAKITAVRIPGQLTGMTVRSRALSRPHPSTWAASSISGGTVLKNPLSSHVQYGTVNEEAAQVDGCGRLSALLRTADRKSTRLNSSHTVISY